MTEREQFEAWWEAERQRRWVENGMADRKGPTASAHWCAGLEHDHWRGWQARAALAQPVAASDVQVPNTFKLPGESDEAWVGRITWPAGTPEPVFVYSGQSGRELEDLLEGYDFGTAFYTSPPAAQPVAAEPSIEDLCARIKAADDAAADNDYMLDSDDCIRVLRGTWKGPLAMDKPKPPTPA